jgi:hypothetical protein
MWEMFSNSLQLLLKGKLFREPGAVFRQWLIGFVLCVVAVVALVKLGTPVWLSVILVAFAGGALQPLLFKNLKYD